MLIRLFTHCFASLFGRDDPELQRLSSLPLEAWSRIAKPDIMRHGPAYGTLTVFPYEHKQVKDAIKLVKNRRNRDVAHLLATVTADFLKEELSDLYTMEHFTDPLLVCVPASRASSLARGFNPALLLCKELACIAKLDYMTGILRKSRATKSQKTLSRSARLKNVRLSMEVPHKMTRHTDGRCVIVVDDVATTGATLAEAKRALMKAGARKVLCLAFAH